MVFAAELNAAWTKLTKGSVYVVPCDMFLVRFEPLPKSHRHIRESDKQESYWTTKGFGADVIRQLSTSNDADVALLKEGRSIHALVIIRSAGSNDLAFVGASSEGMVSGKKYPHVLTAFNITLCSMVVRSGMLKRALYVSPTTASLKCLYKSYGFIEAVGESLCFHPRGFNFRSLLTERHVVNDDDARLFRCLVHPRTFFENPRRVYNTVASEADSGAMADLFEPLTEQERYKMIFEMFGLDVLHIDHDDLIRLPLDTVTRREEPGQ